MVLLHGDQHNPQVVLTQRAMHLNSHAGEVAFPGGMWDRTDADLLYTALRETEEEIGLASALVEPIAMLPEASPKRRKLRVTPFVGLAQGPLELQSEPSEIAAIFDAPVSLFTNINNYQYFEMNHELGALSFPCLSYNGYKIWGFTLKVLVDLFNSTLDAGVELEYPSEQLIEELRSRGQ
jgi:8-oxo-dGTP pyrophosphatase MutT (NUDIX family)